MDEEIEDVDDGEELARHQLAKALLAVVATFAASALVKKAYDAALDAYRNRETITE
jgi:hypothetical protein